MWWSEWTAHLYHIHTPFSHTWDPPHRYRHRYHYTARPGLQGNRKKNFNNFRYNHTHRMYWPKTKCEFKRNVLVALFLLTFIIISATISLHYRYRQHTFCSSRRQRCRQWVSHQIHSPYPFASCIQRHSCLQCSDTGTWRAPLTDRWKCCMQIISRLWQIYWRTATWCRISIGMKAPRQVTGNKLEKNNSLGRSEVEYCSGYWGR